MSAILEVARITYRGFTIHSCRSASGVLGWKFYTSFGNVWVSTLEMARDSIDAGLDI